MLGRRASSSHPSRSQSEMPQFFNRLLALPVPEKTAGHILRQISDNSPDLAPRRFPFGGNSGLFGQLSLLKSSHSQIKNRK
jgi:hypothetical protein